METNTITETVSQEAKRLLLQIPEEDFIKDKFTNEVNACCALGHYQRLKSKNPDDYSTENCTDVVNFRRVSLLRVASKAFMVKKRYDTEPVILRFYGNSEDADIAFINNFATLNGYTETSIKDRVIHFLDDMIEAGY